MSLASFQVRETHFNLIRAEFKVDKFAPSLMVFLLFASACSLPSSGESSQSLHSEGVGLSLYTLSLEPFDGSVDICESENAIGTADDAMDLGCLPSGNRIYWEGDLNSDGIVDYIVVNRSAVWGEGDISIFFVLAGVGGGQYGIVGELYSTSLAPSSEVFSGFKEIKSISDCIDSRSGRGFKVERSYYFSVEERKYASEVVDNEMQPCSH